MTQTPPDPGQPQPWQPPQPPAGGDAPQMTDPAKPKKGGVARWLVPAIVLAGLAGMGGAGYYAYTALAGRGDQPSMVIPGNAIGYLRIDTNPSVIQQIASVRFLSKSPEIKDAGLGDVDWRKRMIEQLKKSNDGGTLKNVDYDKDIAPWLGDKVAVAALPPASGDQPTVVVALQVKDEAKARASIEKLSKNAGSQSDVTFRDGYALITDKGKGAGVTAAFEKGSLATNKNFTADMDALGEQGIFSGWADLKSMTKFSNGSTTAGAQNQLDKAGRAAFALRFNADYIELAGVGRGASGLKKLSGTEASQIGTLPLDTAAALSISGADQVVDQVWKGFIDNSASLGTQGDSIKSQIDQMAQQFGIKLPDDLKTLLGKRLLIALPEQDMSGGNTPQVGLKVTTDAQKAEEIIGKLEQVASGQGQESPLKHKANGQTFYLATTQGYLDELSKDGKLGDSATFKLAVPNAGDEQFTAYFDLDKLEKLYVEQVPTDQREFVKTLRAIGLSGSVKEDGNSTFSLRIVGN